MRFLAGLLIGLVVRPVLKLLLFVVIVTVVVALAWQVLDADAAGRRDARPARAHRVVE